MTSFSARRLACVGISGQTWLSRETAAPRCSLRPRDSMIGFVKKFRHETRDYLRGLTHLDLDGCARCRATQRSRSVSVFPHALEDADPDIPMLKDTKAEYAKLQ